MENKLFIPDRINVGLQGRRGTYTGKLAYIIYWDKKGVLRKETSWESWRWKEAELQGLEKRLDALISPEMKRELELKQIEKLLGE